MIVDPDPSLREHALRVDAYSHRVRSTHGPSRSASPTIPRSASASRPRWPWAIAASEEPAALEALGRIAARDAADPWMRLAILSGLAESAPAFIPLCDKIPPSEGRSDLLSQCAAIVGARDQCAGAGRP